MYWSLLHLYLDGANASALLGTLDSAFLFAYAAAMFARSVTFQDIYFAAYIKQILVFLQWLCSRES